MSTVHAKFGEFPVHFDELTTEGHLVMREATFKALVNVYRGGAETASSALTKLAAERDELLAKLATADELGNQGLQEIAVLKAELGTAKLSEGAALQRADKANEVAAELKAKLTSELAVNTELVKALDKAKADLEWDRGEKKALEEKLSHEG